MVRKNTSKKVISIIVLFKFYYCYLNPPLELVFFFYRNGYGTFVLLLLANQNPRLQKYGGLMASNSSVSLLKNFLG